MPDPLTMDPLDRARALLPEVRRAVREAGALALGHFRHGNPTTARTWTKAGDSPVTEADLAVDALLRERLGALAPEAGWLSEESIDSPIRLERSLVWIVDPIDGTRSFAAGDPTWSVCVALVASGRPLLGIVHAPVPNTQYEALFGGGATRDDVTIRVSDRPDLAGARVAGPKPMIERLDRYLASQGAGRPLERLPRVGSLALRMVRVADGTIEVGLAGGRAHDWDIAGADLILHEAGGVLGDAGGRVPVYNRPEPVHAELVASTGRLHALVRAGLSGP